MHNTLLPHAVGIGPGNKGLAGSKTSNSDHATAPLESANSVVIRSPESSPILRIRNSAFSIAASAAMMAVEESATSVAIRKRPVIKIDAASAARTTTPTTITARSNTMPCCVERTIIIPNHIRLLSAEAKRLSGVTGVAHQRPAGGLSQAQGLRAAAYYRYRHIRTQMPEID